MRTAHSWPLWPLLGTALLLGACGGSGNDNVPVTMASTAPAATPARGTLLNPPTKVASYTPSDLLSNLGLSDVGKVTQTLSLNPVCSVDVYHIQYQTVGGQGEPATASGAIMVPSGTQPQCQGARPIVLYAHATQTVKTFNIADISATGSNEGQIVALVFTAAGYTVVAPNYAGYDTSSLTYHPFLNGDQQSKDMIDGLAAARSALPMTNPASVTDSGKLFITGYSQGGYVAMATHRAMQLAGQNVTASAPMSGPYALSAFSDSVFAGQVNGGSVIDFTMTATSYQHSYGNVYAVPTDVFEAAYASGIDAILPTTSTVGDLYAQGRLPQNQLFNSQPPAPIYASITPATMPSNLAPAFAIGFGPNNLVTNQYRQQYLTDAQNNPDGGFPTLNTNQPPATPTLGLRQDFKVNDLRNWQPVVPILLCGGDGDPNVFFANTQLMQSYWTTQPPLGPLTVVNIDSSGDPYGDLKAGFAAAKDLVKANAIAGGATDGGQAAVLQVYHAGLVPPFCVTVARRFFDTL
jgi:hypothetical protein